MLIVGFLLKIFALLSQLTVPFQTWTYRIIISNDKLQGMIRFVDAELLYIKHKKIASEIVLWLTAR